MCALVDRPAPGRVHEECPADDAELDGELVRHGGQQPGEPGQHLAGAVEGEQDRAGVDAGARTAARLAELGGLRDGLEAGEAAAVLRFYFGYSSYFTCADENGWTYEKAERWLLAQARAALL